MSSFRVLGLPEQAFSYLFGMSDVELSGHYARRMVADSGGFPCRISLTDAAPGDTVILVNYEHHPANSPYRSSFAVYVREGERMFDAIDDIPEQLRKRLLSLRGYDADGMLRAADVIEGQRLEVGIERMFAEREIAYLHAHFAKPGCYAARIERA